MRRRAHSIGHLSHAEHWWLYRRELNRAAAPGLATIGALGGGSGNKPFRKETTMADIIENEVPALAAITGRVTKSAAVVKLLSRNRGATLTEIMAATHWQAHSCRAFLTGLRKKGMELFKETRRDGETSYRIER
jgi:hypothetical protein